MPGEGRVVEISAEQKLGEEAAVERRFNATILAGVASAHKREANRLASLLRQLLTEGTLMEKAEYAASAGSTYSLPNRLAKPTETARFRPAADGGVQCRATRCLQSHTEQVCNNRSICKVVCAGAVGGIGGAIGGGVGGGVGVGGAVACNEVCQTVPECRSVTVCDQYQWSGPGCF